SATEAKGFNISEDDTGRYYRVDRGTTNMQEATKRSKWFKFASVNFGNETAEYRADNVGVSTAWTPPNAFERLNPEEQSAVIDAVRDGKGELRLDSQSGNWVRQGGCRSSGMEPGG